MGATPAMVFTLLARPLPANTRRPAASCTSTHESAEKLKRRRARPIPAMASGFAGDDVARESGVAAAPLGGAAAVKGSDDADEGAGAGEPRGGGAEPATAAAESVAPSVDGALGFAARVSLAAGTPPRGCHGFHQSTAAASNTTAAEPAISGQCKSFTAGQAGAQ